MADTHNRPGHWRPLGGGGGVTLRGTPPAPLGEAPSYFDVVRHELEALYAEARDGILPDVSRRDAAETVVFREVAKAGLAGVLTVELARGEPASGWLCRQSPTTIAAVLTIVRSSAGDVDQAGGDAGVVPERPNGPPPGGEGRKPLRGFESLPRPSQVGGDRPEPQFVAGVAAGTASGEGERPAGAPLPAPTDPGAP